jgi:hypothetical protein
MGAAVGVGVGAIIGGEGLPDREYPPAAVRKKKSTTRLFCREEARLVRGLPVARQLSPRPHPETELRFWRRSLEKQPPFGGVARADPEKDLPSFCCFGEPSRGVAGEAGVAVAIFKRAPEGMPGTLGRGCGREGEKRVRILRLERVPGLHVRVDKEVHV